MMCPKGQGCERNRVHVGQCLGMETHGTIQLCSIVANTPGSVVIGGIYWTRILQIHRMAEKWSIGLWCGCLL